MITPAALKPFLPTALEKTDFKGLGEKYAGKVRDVYIQKEKGQAILIATDRQSAFDIRWCSIPLKGQALNQLSTWWFGQVKDVMPNHIIAVPDPNAMVVKDLKMLKVEIVVRDYLTGSTGTSAWVNYNKGVRDFCGNTLPEGMVKNQRFATAIVTPTTKGAEDELIDPKGIVERGFATKEQWEEIADRAFALFKKGQEIAALRGLILVDTKYEMGYDEAGTLTIADEVHTPDSSRYWVKDTYEERFTKGEEPESLDKEFFRLWLRSQGFEYGGKHPDITDEVRLMLASKYLDLYERMTGKPFVIPSDAKVAERIERNLAPFRL
ncbi:phosphoribosylaminoimidazolesuccinocarboxamide synthase [Candidatus Peregrinibacteria bacterium CG1_02_54_53]|nr:MAG: phosphoribosylaminoimidazolesuccinocarboxamide synthase [Candidatus Peregrinibacteria bacterium CG1_02_54_53]